MVGSCFLDCLNLKANKPTGCQVDLFVVNNAADLPPLGRGSLGESYDFQVIQMPLRTVFLDASLWALPYGALESYEKELENAYQRLATQLELRMQWNRSDGLLTFVSNFFTPQCNPLGRLFPRFDLRNPEYFIEKLNERLERLVREYKNAFVLDVDRIAASIGRRYIQDDIIAHFAHNALVATTGRVTDRIEPIEPMVAHYEVTWPAVLRDEIWAEMLAMYRAVRQADAVKLVVVDLDDTLWNGVSGDCADVDPAMVEGWPLGLVEALMYLKKRGVLLAICSKNEESRIREIWPRIFGARISLDDFAAVSINWRPKAENMAEILAGVSLLARSVVFIDDNPVERAAMQQAFPDMRILGRHPYYLRRILLWSSETQVVSVTEESARRTEMVQAQIGRETERKVMSREAFLTAAAPRATMQTIDSVDHPRFGRCLELINKTNQFNTTGVRRTLEELDGILQGGARLYAFEVEDSYTTYGLVGVVLVQGARIEQWVMSCRILGYDIESAVMGVIVGDLRGAGAPSVTAPLVETAANFPCRDLYAKLGFEETKAGEWRLDESTALVQPAHVLIR